jgi:hypothetical protein
VGPAGLRSRGFGDRGAAFGHVLKDLMHLDFFNCLTET